MNDQSLEARFAALEQLEQIRSLKACYAAACDDGYSPEAVARLFTPTGTWERPDADVKFQGHEEIRAAMAANGRKYRWSSHILGAPQISLEPGLSAAIGTWPMTSLLLKTDQPDFLSVVAGRYEDRFERVDGVWLISRLVVHVKHSSEILRHKSH